MRDRRRKRRLRGQAEALWRPVVAAGLLLVAWLSVSACSIEKHHEVLSLFFDGVPLPNNAVDSTGQRIGPPRVVSVHAPFSDASCDSCHKATFSFGTVGRGAGTKLPDSGVCVSCHESVADEHELMHAPVITNACLWCHDPHQSFHESLLKEAPIQLCTQCHAADTLDNKRVPAHSDGVTSCTECHSGHGGPEPYFLRALLDFPNEGSADEPLIEKVP